MSEIPIAALPSSERPRDRLIELGPQALSNAELISLLFRTGVKGSNSIDMRDEYGEFINKAS